jgi:Synaptobrevin
MFADTFIQKTKKLYMDTRTQRNISKLNADIAEVHSVMTRNIQDVLQQGERLDSECWMHWLRYKRGITELCVFGSYGLKTAYLTVCKKVVQE